MLRYARRPTGASLRRIDHHTSHSRNNFFDIRHIGGEDNKHKAFAIRHFNVSGVVARGACPASFRPQFRAGYICQCNAGKIGGLRVVLVIHIAFEQFQQLAAALSGWPSGGSQRPCQRNRWTTGSPVRPAGWCVQRRTGDRDQPSQVCVCVCVAKLTVDFYGCV